MKKQQGNTLLIIVIVVILVAIFVLVFNKNQRPGDQTTSIQDTVGLDSASKDLDNTDLNQIDTAQNQINSDTSNF